MKLLSVDPGKRTGWAVWDFGEVGQPELHMMGVTKTVEEFYDFLANSHMSQIVYENYHIYPKGLTNQWGHEWNRPPALLIIGALEFYARQNEVRIASQPSSVLPAGCGYIGYDYKPKVHVPNNVSAIAHGAYWLVKNKYTNSRQFSTLPTKQADNSIK